MKPILTVLFLILSSTTFGQWVKVFEDYGTIYYYNPNRTTVNYGEVTTWVKIEYKGENKNVVINDLNKTYAKNRIRFNDLSSILSKMKIRCSSLSFQTNSKAFYNRKGSVIHNWQGNDFDWTDCPPGTVIEAACTKICELTNN